MPPLVVKIRGENVAFSTSSTLLQYCLFFSLALLSRICSGSLFAYRMAVGLTTLTSANTFWYGTKTPLALTSSLASCAVLTDFLLNDSPVNGSRGGSILTSWHACWSRSAVRSRSSLWRMEVKPPKWQDSAWLMEKGFIAKPVLQRRLALSAEISPFGLIHH